MPAKDYSAKTARASELAHGSDKSDGSDLSVPGRHSGTVMEKKRLFGSST
jgi:hypothetical protein